RSVLDPCAARSGGTIAPAPQGLCMASFCLGPSDPRAADAGDPASQVLPCRSTSATSIRLLAAPGTQKEIRHEDATHDVERGVGRGAADGDAHLRGRPPGGTWDPGGP